MHHMDGDALNLKSTDSHTDSYHSDKWTHTQKNKNEDSDSERKNTESDIEKWTQNIETKSRITDLTVTLTVNNNDIRLPNLVTLKQKH